jgi:predicted 2-oxoglutarate/Fe(II)-dependent dioxygenase YbiX
MIIESNKKIFTDDELKELTTSWYLETEEIWKTKDRSYISCYSNNHQKIVDKLLSWAESVGDFKLNSYNINLIFHKFEENDKFDSHIDYTNFDNRQRLFVTGFLTENNFTGGDYFVDNYGTLSKEVGVPYLFDSHTKHGISPVLSGTRKSVLIFLFDSHIKKIGLDTSKKSLI